LRFDVISKDEYEEFDLFVVSNDDIPPVEDIVPIEYEVCG